MGCGEPVFGGVWFRDDRGQDRPYPRGNIPLDSGSAPSLRIEGTGRPLFTSSAPFRSLGWWTQRLELGAGNWTSPVRWQGLLDGEGSMRCGCMVELKSAMAPSLAELVVPWLLPSERVAWREVPWLIPSEQSALDERRHGPSLSAGTTGVSGT